MRKPADARIDGFALPLLDASRRIRTAAAQ
jgi:hypothetical protein